MLFVNIILKDLHSLYIASYVAMFYLIFLKSFDIQTAVSGQHHDINWSNQFNIGWNNLRPERSLAGVEPTVLFFFLKPGLNEIQSTNQLTECSWYYEWVPKKHLDKGLSSSVLEVISFDQSPRNGNIGSKDIKCCFLEGSYWF